LLVGAVSVQAFSFGKYEKVKINGPAATIPQPDAGGFD